MLRILVPRLVTHSSWVSDSRRSEGTFRLHLQGFKSPEKCLSPILEQHFNFDTFLATGTILTRFVVARTPCRRVRIRCHWDCTHSTAVSYVYYIHNSHAQGCPHPNICTSDPVYMQTVRRSTSREALLITLVRHRCTSPAHAWSPVTDISP